MNNTTENGLKPSITFEVIKFITLYYILVAIILIIVQVVMEYHNIKKDIDQNITNLSSSFDKTLTNSLWEINKEQTDTIIKGILDSPYILAVELYHSDGSLISRSSKKSDFKFVGSKDEHSLDFYFNPLRTFLYKFNLSKQMDIEPSKDVGKMVIYSGNSVILEHLSRIIFYIVMNSILQTITIWIILIFFINLKVRDPLKELVLKIQSTNPQDPKPIDSLNKYNTNEFRLIVSSFNALTSELKKYKDVLEAIIDNKTEMLKERNIEVRELIGKLESAQSQLINQEKLNSLGLMSAGIAHELKNPLNISLNSIVILKDILKLNDKGEVDLNNISSKQIGKLAPVLDIIQNSNSRMDKIIKSMLLQSRTEYAQPTLINLDSFININLNILQKSLNSNSSALISLETFIPKDLEIKIFPNEFGRLLVNLLENSFYGIEEKLNSTTIDITNYKPSIQISALSLEGDKVLIKIHDNGTGIKNALINKVQEPFFTTKPPGAGTGLGLHLAYDIVKNHQGKIKISSEEGEYTEVQITLPSII